MVLLKQMVHVTSNTYASSTHEETKTPNTLEITKEHEGW